MHKQASRYLDLGWSIIPAKLGTKIPLIKWSQYQDKRPTVEEVGKWFLDWRQINLAVVCGQVSNLFVIDIDSFYTPDGKVDDLAVFLYGLTTPQVETNRGVHIYFSIDGDPLFASRRLSDCCEFKSTGSLVTLPPSIHPSGWVYRWRISPIDCLPMPLPNAITALLTIDNRKEPSRAVDTSLHIGEYPPYVKAYCRSALRWACDSVATAPEGYRNQTLNNNALGIGEIVAAGGLDAEVAELGLIESALTCGLSRSEAVATVKSAFTATRNSPRDLRNIRPPRK